MRTPRDLWQGCIVIQGGDADPGRLVVGHVLVPVHLPVRVHAAELSPHEVAQDVPEARYRIDLVRLSRIAGPEPIQMDVFPQTPLNVPLSAAVALLGLTMLLLGLRVRRANKQESDA